MLSAFIVVWEVLVSARRELNGCLRNFGQREEPPGSRESVWCGFESAALTRAMQQSRLATRTTQVGAGRILCHREVGRAFGVVSSHWLSRRPCNKVVRPRAQRRLGWVAFEPPGSRGSVWCGFETMAPTRACSGWVSNMFCLPNQDECSTRANMFCPTKTILPGQGLSARARTFCPTKT